MTSLKTIQCLHILMLLPLAFLVAEGSFCDRDLCASIMCAIPNCPNGYKVIYYAGCGCCPTCVQTLDEGSACSPEPIATFYVNGSYSVSDAPHPPVCKDGLFCANGVCKAAMPCNANSCDGSCRSPQCAETLFCVNGFKSVPNADDCGCSSKCVPTLDEGSRCFTGLHKTPYGNGVYTWRDYQTVCKDGLDCVGGYPYPMCKAINTDTCTSGDGQRYVTGQTFPSRDGCNTCTCMQDGNAACTEMACVPETCSDVKQKILDRGQLIGEYLPQCNGDGSYRAKQCGPGPVCHCVNEHNVGIGSYSAQVWEALNMTCLCAREKEHDNTMACTELGNHYESCAHRRDVAHAKGLIPGQYVPQCNDDGSYKAKQCGPGSVCRCVNEQNKQIGQYIVPIWKTAEMTCLCARQQELVQDVSFRCTELGNFNTFTGVFLNSEGVLLGARMTSLLLFVTFLRLLF